MLLLLSLVSSALAAPQFYPYAYPSAYYQYPVHYPMVHPVYGYPHQAIYPSATAGAPMQRIGVATSSLLAASVSRCPGELRRRSARTSPGRFATMFLASSATMFPVSSARMFQDRNVTMCQDRFATMFLASSATMF